ncbi:MAG: RNA polymerase sigma factor [Myxococcota bacterium]
MDRPNVRALYEQYGYAVHRRCLRILGSHAEADDATQEVFIRVMKYGQPQQLDAPLAWLYRIADRQSFDQLAKRRRRAGPSETERALAAEEAATGSELDPTDIRAIATALEGCRTSVREVAVLYHFDQLTQDEVAARVGVSRKTVKQRLAKFMHIARKQFGVTPPTRKEAS